MRKKKILIGLTTAFLALTALASCGSSKSGGESKSSSSVVENSSESSKDEQKSSSEQNQGQGEESSSEQNQGQGEESSSEQNQGQGNESESSSTVESVIEGDSYKFGFGDGLTSWSVLPEKAGTKEVTDKNGKKTTVLASAVSVDQFSFSQNDKNRVDPIKNELEEIIGYVYVSQKAEITIVLKTKGKIHAEGNWGSTSTAGKIYVKNGSTAVYTSQQYTASTENVIDFETTVLDAGTYVISSDASVKYTKLYYEREYNPVTVAFSTEHGSVDSVTAEAGDVITLPELSEEGFVFKGWYTENSSTGTKVTSPYTVTAGTTLYAKWVEYNTDNYATVTFNTGVSGINKQSAVVEKGSTYSVEALEYDGYRFMGWFTDSDFKYSYTGTITDSVTLYAQFIKLHTVSYQYDDGTEISSEKVLDNESLTSVPSVKTIYGKRFIGWKLNNADFDTTSAITGDLVLVATYETLEVSDSITIMNSGAYQEGLYAEFMAFEGATSYNAYVKLDDGSYKALDSQLIRKYKDDDNNNYYRVDAVGLKAGKYTLKIAPVFDDTEATDAMNEVANLSVIAHDRSGFAFVNGTSSGAYNDDGTLKSNAEVLYITQNTKDTVSMDVVTNNKGATENAVGLQAILNLYKKGCDTRPLDVRFIGQITDLATMEGGDIVISGSGSSSRVSCGITFEGIGNDATIDGWGLRIKNASNVEVRNLGFMNCDSSEGDDCGLQQDNDHVWVHNCDFFYGDAGSDADQVKGDGALDTKKSTYVTNSYNHFWDCGKCNLLGLSEGAGSTPETWCITYHHNWYDHSDSRHPRVRYYTAHVYNNYYDGNAKYGVGATLGSSVFVENNYFRNCKNPIMTSMQGTDVYAGTTSYSEKNATFSSEAGGSIKSYGNVMVGNYTYIPYGCTTYVCKGTEVAYDLSGTTSTVDFDAYEASSRDEVISDSVVSRSGSNKYNNFDTSSSMYTYTVQSAEDARNTVIQYSGRVQGGDFKWTFTEADDTSYAVNQDLKNALMAYKTKLVSVQGEEEAQSSGGEEGGNSDPQTATVDDVIALIAALPDPTSVVEADRTQIMAAKSAYDSLSESDQALVTNSSKLTNCINALPAQSSFSIDYRTASVTFKTDNVTIYNDNDILITATKVDSQDSTYGIKFNSGKSFTITNNSSSTKTFVLNVVSSKASGNSFTCDGTTYNLTKSSSTITFVLEANQSKTVSTSTGQAYLTSITVS